MEVPCSGVPLGSLAGFWDGCRLCEINSRVWRSKRTEEILIICHQCLQQSLIANWVKVLMFLIVVASYCRRDQGDCLRWSLFLCAIFDLKQDSRQSSYVILHDMWCQWWRIAFLTLTTFGMYLPSQSKDWWTGLNRYCFPCNVCKTFRNEMWPVVHFFFRICPMPNAVSVGIWMPSSASTPQVGFLSMTTSSTPEER